MPSAEVGGRRAQEPRLELLAVVAVVDPFARGRDPPQWLPRGRQPSRHHDARALWCAELMTFSRRAAAEMTRRVERIARRVMGERADIMTDALAWAGTFHAIGARLLRDYAGSQLHHS
jgi:hypothetical protein